MENGKKIVIRFVFTTLVFLGAFNSKIIAQEAFKAQRKMIGKEIKDVKFTDHIANVPNDIDFNSKYKIIEFWATWCKPCLKAVPKINKLKTEFINQKDLVFLSVTYESPEKVNEILDRVDFQTMVVSDQNRKIQKELKIEFEGQIVLPRIVLIDNTNKIVWYGGPEDLNSRRIVKFLKKKSR
jgi:thiol-disulfide isomerase/thioredoxin